jgi:hypothetical protein
VVEILSLSFPASILQCDFWSEKFSTPSALTEENSASLETTTRLRFSRKLRLFKIARVLMRSITLPAAS